MISKVNKINSKFIEIEKKLKLFKLKDKNGVVWWDIVRYMVYEDIYHIEMKSDPIKKPKIKVDSIITGIIKDFKYLFNVKLNQVEYIFFISSRENINGQFQDKIMYDLYKDMLDNSFIIESFANPNLDDRNYVFYNMFIKIIKKTVSKLRKILKFNISNDYLKVCNELNNAFNINDKNRIVNLIKKILIEWKIEEFYYTYLFKFIKPKKIFVIQNGVQKAIFFSANKLSIPCYEFQHGQMNRYHMLYTYPSSIETLQTLPLAIFTFGSHWGQNYPVKHRYIIGKKFLCNHSKDNGICIIFNSQSFNKLLQFTIELYNKKYELKKNVYIKLHPIQKEKFHLLNELVGDKFNIVPVDMRMELIYPKIDSVLITDSTCIYESIYLKKIVYVLNTEESYINEECFNNSNVHIIDNPTELDKKYNYDFQQSDYYQDYNYEIVDKIIFQLYN